MKKILAIGASNSSTSINKKFATYIANQLKDVEVTVLNWDEFVLPLFSVDLEKEIGIPENAVKFKTLIEAADAVVLSMAEHNGLPSAAYKNLSDWTSRIEPKFWAGKPMFLAATSPGGRGGASVLQVTKELIPRFGANLIVDFSLPSFQQNFEGDEVVNSELKATLLAKVQLFQKAI